MSTVNLEQESKQISALFSNWSEELKRVRAERIVQYQEAVDEYKEAARHGDARENSALTTATENKESYGAEIEKLTKQINLIEQCIEDYVPIGMVILYSTVYIKCLTDGTEYIFKVYPDGVSDLSKRIIERCSRLGKALWRKKKGHIFTLSHRVSLVPLKYEILDIY